MARKTEGPAARALTAFEKDFEKSFGEGVMETPHIRPYEVVSTGSLTLDRALGCGGMVVGRMSEWIGPGGSCKTTTALTLASEFQKAYPDRLIGWIDVERSWDDRWAKDHGVNLKLVRKTKPNVAQDVADHAQKMMQSGLFSLLVIDSVGGMMGRRESEGLADDVQVAEVAKVVTRLVKHQAHLLDTHRAHMVVINQPRANIGGGPRAGDIGGGGKALSMATVHKLKFRQTGEETFKIKHGTGPTAVEEEVGFQVAVFVDRNKVAPRARTATFNIFNQASKYGPIGVDRAEEAFTLGVRYGIITKPNPASSYYLLPDREKTVNGKDNVIAALRESVDLVESIRAQVLSGIAVADVLPDVDDDTPQEGETDDLVVPAEAASDEELFGDTPVPQVIGT